MTAMGAIKVSASERPIFRVHPGCLAWKILIYVKYTSHNSDSNNMAINHYLFCTCDTHISVVNQVNQLLHYKGLALTSSKIHTSQVQNSK